MLCILKDVPPTNNSVWPLGIAQVLEEKEEEEGVELRGGGERSSSARREGVGRREGRGKALFRRAHSKGIVDENMNILRTLLWTGGGVGGGVRRGGGRQQNFY